MAYLDFKKCTAKEYEQVIYSQDDKNRIKILFNGVEYPNPDMTCEKLTVTSRIIPENGSKRFSIDNFIAKEAQLIIHNIDLTKIVNPVEIQIGTFVKNDYEYVPIGIFNVQDIPTTDKDKTTIKLRDNAVKFDFTYNAKDYMDSHGGVATLKEILQDICSKANVVCQIQSFEGENINISIYDNTITARTYVSYIAEQAGAIATINRKGELIFIYLNNLAKWQIPLNIVEKYEKGDVYKIERVVYESGIIKYETSTDENLDTLYLNSANPYINSKTQIDKVFDIVKNFNIDSVTTGKILGNPAIDPYDIIEVIDTENNNEVIFKTLGNNDYVYNGVNRHKFLTEIGKEARTENVSMKSEEAFKKYAKTEIDNLNGTVKIMSGKVDDYETRVSNLEIADIGINASITNINKNYETIVTTEKTATGNPAYIEDALEDNAINYIIYGNSEQETRSENLLLEDNLELGTYVDYFAPTDNSYVSRTKNPIYLKKGTFIINASGVNVVAYNSSKNRDNKGWFNLPYTLNVNEEDNFKFMFKNTSNVYVKPTNIDFYIDKPTPEYPSEIETVKGIENLLDLIINTDSYTKGLTISKNDDFSLKITGTSNAGYSNITSRNSCSILAGTYIFSIYNIKPFNVVLRLYYDNTNYMDCKITSGTVKKTITIPNDVVGYYVFLETTNGTEYNETLYLQLEKGDESHYFVPYGTWLPVKVSNDEKENITLIDMNMYDSLGNIIGHYELCKIDDMYDELNVTTGVLIKKISKVVLDGNENFTQVTTSTTGKYRWGLNMQDLKRSSSTSEIPSIKSTHYNPVPIGAGIGTWNNVQGISSNNNSNTFFIYDNTYNTNLNEYKNWLKSQYDNGTPVTIYYEMVTPETIQLDKNQLSLFENINNITVEANEIAGQEITYKTNTVLNETYATRNELTATADNLQININKIIDNGVDKVRTSTNYTFDEEGMRVEKEGADTGTIVTEDGLEIYSTTSSTRESILEVHSEGVNAENITVRTYLYLGTHCRAEDFDGGTGFFFIE